MPTNGMQQSEENATRNGVQALGTAYSSVQTCRQEVETIKTNLLSHYKGSDGAGFRDLVTAWEEQADVILKNVQDMADTLNDTLAEHTRQQSAQNEEINQVNQESQSVFDTLVG